MPEQVIYILKFRSRGTSTHTMKNKKQKNSPNHDMNRGVEKCNTVENHSTDI